MRPGFFAREALRALKRNAVPSFAAMATVLVTVLVLGVFIPVVQATTGAANEVRSRVIADVYLKSGATSADVDRVGRLIRSNPDVKSVQFVSKEQAYREERARNPQAYQLLGANPLPDMFRVTPRRPDDIGAVRDALAPLAPGGGRTVVDPLAADFALMAAPQTMSFAPLVALLLAASVAVSAAGSGLSLRRFLRV